MSTVVHAARPNAIVVSGARSSSVCHIASPPLESGGPPEGEDRADRRLFKAPRPNSHPTPQRGIQIKAYSMP
jgi:hypothetical protein